MHGRPTVRHVGLRARKLRKMKTVALDAAEIDAYECRIGASRPAHSGTRRTSGGVRVERRSKRGERMLTSALHHSALLTPGRSHQAGGNVHPFMAT